MQEYQRCLINIENDQLIGAEITYSAKSQPMPMAWLAQSREAVTRETVTDLATNVARLTIYRRGARRHRDPSQGPAFIRRVSNNIIVEEKFLFHGSLHRLDGPAHIVTDAQTRAVVYECWAEHGREHRDGGPSSRKIVGGLIVEEQWLNRHIPLAPNVYSCHHRNPNDGPALFLRDRKTGIMLHEAYYYRGEKHRDPLQGPAWIWRDETTGIATSVSYYWNGVLHRAPRSGPAKIERDAETGEITKSVYYWNSVRVESDFVPLAPVPSKWRELEPRRPGSASRCSTRSAIPK